MIELTPVRLMALCDLAYDGANDDAGREFVGLCRETFVASFNKSQQEQVAQAKATLEAQQDEKIKKAVEEALAQQEARLRSELGTEIKTPEPPRIQTNGKEKTT